MKTKTKLLTAGGTLALALTLYACNNYYHELVPSDDNDILSFVLDGQIGSSKITRDAVYVTMKFDPESSYKMVPRISVPPKASIIPLTYEYLIAAFPHLKELPEEELLDEISKFTNAPDRGSYLMGLIERSPGFNIPALDMPIDFFTPVDFLVIGGQGGIRRYTSRLNLLFESYSTEGGVEMALKDPGGFMMGNDYHGNNYYDQNVGEYDRLDAYNGVYNDDTGKYWWLNNTAPAHEVELTKTFYIGKQHITNGQFANVMEYIPPPMWPEDNYYWGLNFAAYVTFYEAVEYCNKLSELEGFQPYYNISGKNVTRNIQADGYRLLTEAEFYYAVVPEELATFKAASAILGSYDFSDWETRTEITDFLKPFKPAPSNITYGYRVEPRTPYFSDAYWTWCWDWFAPYEYFKESLEAREIRRPPLQTDPSGPAESASAAFLGGAEGKRLFVEFNESGYHRHPGEDKSYFIIARNAE